MGWSGGKGHAWASEGRWLPELQLVPSRSRVLTLPGHLLPGQRGQGQRAPSAPVSPAGAPTLSHPGRGAPSPGAQRTRALGLKWRRRLETAPPRLPWAQTGQKDWMGQRILGQHHSRSLGWRDE